MLDPGPLYTPLEDELPGVYRRDVESWEQIRTYFRPFNTLCREFVLALHELPAWLSPAAPDVTPPGSWGATSSELSARRNEVLDELASWFDFAFEPDSVWELRSDQVRDEKAAERRLLEDKARALRALPRLMRARATPPGFLELFCTAFRLAPDSADECPVLLEHFASRPPGAEPAPAEEGCADARAAEDDDDDPPDDLGPGISCSAQDDSPVDDGVAWRATLLLPPVQAFSTWTGLSEAEEWIERNAPAHVWIDVYPVTRSFWPELVGTVLPSGAADREEILALVRKNVLDSEALHTDVEPEMDIGRTPGREGGSA